MHYNIPELQSGTGRISHPIPHPSLQPNGLHCTPGARRNEVHQMDSESEEGDEDEDEEEPRGPRWHGIESIFEAYQDYVEGELLLWVLCF